jgi:glutamate/aspartate transport system permease protein
MQNSSYYWDWQVFNRISDDGQFYWQWLLNGAQETFKIGILAFALAFFLGSILGVWRTFQRPSFDHESLFLGGLKKFLRLFATCYVELFRNIPLIVQLFLWYHVLPEIVPEKLGDYMKQDLSPWVIGFVALGLFTACRIAEQVRAALNTQTTGQIMAATSLGLKNWQNYLYIRLPMAYRIAFPTLTSEAMNVFKNSSVTFAVGVLEIFFQGKQIIEKTSQQYETLIVVAGLYMFFCLTVFLIFGQIEKRIRLHGVIGS